MAEPRLFLRNRSIGQTLFRVAFICSLLLNGYFLLLRDHLDQSVKKDAPVVVQGVTISEGDSDEGGEKNAPESSPDQVGASSAKTLERIADTVGEVLDKESGLRLMDLELNKSFAYTFNEALGSEVGDLVSAFSSRIFMWQVDLRTDVRKSDRIRLIYRVLVDDRIVDIRAASYHSRKHKQDFEAYWFKPAGHEYGSFYDEKGSEVPLSLENSPIKNYEQITSLLKDRNRHNGIDFKAPIGTPITSPFDGRVTRVNWRSRNGNCIEVRYTKSGLLARFLHLSKVADGVSASKSVKGGSVIAESGNTGRSTAPHLHYELAKPKNGRIVNPLEFHKTFRKKVPAESMPEFEQIRDHWRKFFIEAP